MAAVGVWAVVVLAEPLGVRFPELCGLGAADGDRLAEGLPAPAADGVDPGADADGLVVGTADGLAVGEGSGVTGWAVRRVTPTAAGSVSFFCAEIVDLMPYFSCNRRRYWPAMLLSKAPTSLGPSPSAWTL